MTEAHASGASGTGNSLFRNAEFTISVAKPDQLPAAEGPEIAFVGRSNAGKSSAINTLVGHKRLAFVSKTPGRTQLINFFRLHNGAFLVDLPGYGYAAVPEAIRHSWSNLIERYLREREALVGIVLIADSRRGLTDLDRNMLSWFAGSNKPVHVLLSKSDKLSKREAADVLRAVRKEMQDLGFNSSVQLFSSLKTIGVDDASKALGAWFGTSAEAADNA